MTARTCDALVSGVERVVGHVEMVHASSIAGARSLLESSRFDACLVCLNLPPAPRGGVHLAQELVARRHPVVLITRSLRWLPVGAVDLHRVPWVTPEADPAALVRAMAKSMDHTPPQPAAATPPEEPLSGAQPALRWARGIR